MLYIKALYGKSSCDKGSNELHFIGQSAWKPAV